MLQQRIAYQDREARSSLMTAEAMKALVSLANLKQTAAPNPEPGTHWRRMTALVEAKLPDMVKQFTKHSG